MTRRDEFAVMRRDDRLIQVRRLTLWIAGAATAVSVGMATVLGSVIPGRAATSGSQAPSGQSGSGSAKGTGAGKSTGSGKSTGAGNGAGSGKGAGPGKGTGGGLAPPSHQPTGSSSQPVVSSGGS